MLRSKAWQIGLVWGALAGAAEAQPGEVIPFPKAGEPVQALPLPGIEPVPQPEAAGCAPPKLFRTTVRNITPGLQAGDRRAQPRQLWRQGALFLRSVEQPIPPNGDQTVTIVSEPDIWIINQATRSGQHARDPGPVFEVRAPILPVAPDAPAVFRRLEYGCEAAFVAEHAPVPDRMLNWGATRAALHTLTVGDQSVAMLVDDRRKEPLMISYLRQGRPVFVMRYDDYQHGLPERPQLFQPPASYKITEAPAQAPQQPSPGEPPPFQPVPGSRSF